MTAFRATACLTAALLAGATLGAAPSPPQTPPVSLELLLRAAGGYVDRYEQRLVGIVAEEEYQQAVLPAMGTRSQTGGGTLSRNTHAYLLTVNLGTLGWATFRDVFELDGRAVRGREERLTRLLQNITPDSLEQARRIAAESARYNLSPVSGRFERTLNVPLAALMYLRSSNQARSVFRLGKTDRIGDTLCATLQFSERARPRLIGTPDEAPAQGTFWIDPSSGGRVVKTELRIETANSPAQFVRSQVTVSYAPADKIDAWLPTVMDEVYEIVSAAQLVTGHAVYSGFREFTVTTSEAVK